MQMVLLDMVLLKILTWHLVHIRLVIGKKVKNIRRIIRQERYRKAYKNLPLNYFPIHWKLFYGCARHGFAFGVYMLLTVIQRIISR